MLRAFAGGAATIAVVALVEAHAALRVHLFDEAGSLRPHVLCFHNGTNTRWRESLDAPLHDGDRLTIMQAVSGG
jgi:molybdopterin converting factor small subunit